MPIFRALQKQRVLISSLQLILMGIVWIGLTFHSCVFAANITENKPHLCCEETQGHCDTTANKEPGSVCPAMSEIDNNTDSEYLATKTVSSPQPAIGYTLVSFPLRTGLPSVPSPQRLTPTASHPALKFRALLI